MPVSSKYILWLLVLLSGLALGLWLVFSARLPSMIRSPWGEVLPAQTSHQPPVIVGFLPYWTINRVSQFDFGQINRLAYFGVAIDEQGAIQTRNPDQTAELGWSRLKRGKITPWLQKNKQTGGQNWLVIRAMSDERIQAALAPEQQVELVDQLVSLARQYQFDGINLDFEPQSLAGSQIQTQLVEFVRRLKQTAPDLEISIDIYASSGTRARIWDLKQLDQQVDYFVFMGYDLVTSESPAAGPHAPIYGQGQWGKYDLNSSLSSVWQQVSAQKLIISLPFYGYRWQTINQDLGSTSVQGQSDSIWYHHILQLLDKCQQAELLQCQTGIDQTSLTAWLVYQDPEDNQWYQVWYDNPQTLPYKLELVQTYQAAGIAVWALGYDQPENQLWQVIRKWRN